MREADELLIVFCKINGEMITSRCVFHFSLSIIVISKPSISLQLYDSGRIILPSVSFDHPCGSKDGESNGMVEDHETIILKGLPHCQQFYFIVCLQPSLHFVIHVFPRQTTIYHNQRCREK